MRCLIVDDSADFRTAATDMLERAGIDVVVACNSDEALTRYAELSPDVTLVDVELGGESGFDLVERLYGADTPAPPVILISTHSEQDYSEMIAASSAIGFLAKFALSPAAITGMVTASRGT
ncbi:response regulator [Mycolicibacterium sp.]|uniref:response regulator n=1 Tax=Mycolicibacterium sp. TaxID=2320850 RepID=UPI001A345077|nr:response regulator [Mycolicibacterium sp.]MBJ7339147.1 response regulator [Mycolicibacterium sp.]